MEKIGIIGAGLMGRGIAKNAKLAGYGVVAHKRKIDDADPNVAYLKKWDIPMTTDMQELFAWADVLFTCLPDSPTMEMVMLGDGGLSHSTERRVGCVLDFTTALPESTRKIARALHECGVDFLDTPMTGGPGQADEGTLNLVVGGKREVLEQHMELLAHVSKHIVHVGGSGNGNAVKLANNFLSLLNRASSAATAVLMKRMGIELESFHEFITLSGGNSKGFQSVMKNIMNDDYSVNFALELAYKDLQYNKEMFKEIGGFSILDSLVDEFKDAVVTGHAKQDVGAIYLSLAEKMGMM